jgi:hypothetical protein
MAEQAALVGRITTPRKPLSPRLAPLTSPGPVTPLDLVEPAGYIVAGVERATGREATHSRDMIAIMIGVEEQRHGEDSS